MTAQLLTAQPVVEKIKRDLAERCHALKNAGIHPSMSVVLVGDNPASLTYIRNKKKVCEEVGANFELHQLSSEISESDFLAKIKSLNNDPSIHGIIIQLPVPEKLKHLDIPNLVTSSKDIDGFHGKNTQHIYTSTVSPRDLLPCTPKGIVSLLKHYGISVEGKNVVVIGRSLIVGKPISLLLSNMNATVTIAHSKTQDLRSFTKKADIVVSAIGHAKYIDGSYFNAESQTTVIDVGINLQDGKLCGDVDMDSVRSVTKAITPVPGGVGPMTVVSLIQNLIIACEEQKKG